jgi:hypothetical protein
MIFTSHGKSVEEELVGSVVSQFIGDDDEDEEGEEDEEVKEGDDEESTDLE